MREINTSFTIALVLTCVTGVSAQDSEDVLLPTLDPSPTAVTTEAGPETPREDPSLVALRSLMERNRANMYFRGEDGRVDAIIGDLSDPVTGDLERAARSFVEANRFALGAMVRPPGDAASSGPGGSMSPDPERGVPPPSEEGISDPRTGGAPATGSPPLRRVNVQDRTPVRLVRFRPEAHGVQFEDGEIQVTFDGDGKIIGLTGAVVPQAEIPVMFGPSAPPRGSIEAALREVGGPSIRIIESGRVERIWHRGTDGRYQGAFRVIVSTERPRGHFHLRLDASGALLSHANMLQTAHGYAFAEYPALEERRVPLPALRSQTHLEGTYARTQQAGGRRRAPAVDGDFLYRPREGLPEWAQGDNQVTQIFNPNFLEVNAYYHVNRANDLLRTVYGASDRGDYQLKIDVMEPYSPGEPASRDNAFYDPRDRSLHFASYAVFQPAADNMVVQHEYGHSIFHRLVVESQAQLESRAINEGFADWVANVLSDHPRHEHLLSRLRDGDSRDGPRERDASRFLTYTDVAGDLRMGAIHDAGNLFSNLAWNLRRRLRHGERDHVRLIMGAIQMSPRPMDFRRVAIGMLLSDVFFFGTRGRETILGQLRSREFPLGEGSTL